MQITYLVTTKPELLAPYALTHQIFMLDGTVPGWSPKLGDHHWDHHKPGGGRVQLEDMPDLPKGLPSQSLLGALSIGKPILICTTKLDADACVAAAWLQIKQGDPVADQENYERFYAIAHDCDYLCVPEKFKGYAEFAAKAVAAMKVVGQQDADNLGLPKNRKEWTSEASQRFYADQFKKSTQWLTDAWNGADLWPGEDGEADEYWQTLEADAKMLASGRVSFIRDVPVIDLRGISRYVDPRSGNMAISKLRSLKDCRPQALTVGCKKFGVQYILGSNPNHPLAETYDYASDGVFKELTKAEAEKRGVNNAEALVDLVFGTPEASKELGFDPWGGRAVVGGSGWNTPSVLFPEEVITVVLNMLG